jgi:hypothetical protein
MKRPMRCAPAYTNSRGHDWPAAPRTLLLAYEDSSTGKWLLAIFHIKRDTTD